MEFRYVFGGNRIDPVVRPFEINDANALFSDAAKYFLSNLIFYSPAIREATMALKDSLNNCLNLHAHLTKWHSEPCHAYSETEKEIFNNCSKSLQLLAKLELLMKNELTPNINPEQAEKIQKNSRNFYFKVLILVCASQLLYYLSCIFL